jgi:ATP-dependent DNA helicase RecG
VQDEQKIPNVYLLTGGQPRAERTRSLDAIASGEADVVVGTHALIQQGVEFDDLALAIVDEQHRFGVAQRTALRDKAAGEDDASTSPHLLVMSATPIPRSLALTVYGDLDLSVIDELPPGRQPVRTRWLLPRERERAYAFVRSQVEEGRQAFILCPLVEGSDKVQARAAVDEHARLQEAVFPDLQVGLLHGRMRSKEKESVMTSFYNRELDILVSTSVVEVGIDVPNASVILVEGADRFGLAQLHQFRGRVGRGEHRSYCLLVSDAASPDDPGSQATWERLKAIEETQDGFVLAEKDLELRGPGEFVGVRQSGLPDLRMGRLSDTRTIEKARQEARQIFDTDPELRAEEHAALAAQVGRFWDRRTSLS